MPSDAIGILSRNRSKIYRRARRQVARSGLHLVHFASVAAIVARARATHGTVGRVLYDCSAGLRTSRGMGCLSHSVSTRPSSRCSNRTRPPPATTWRAHCARACHPSSGPLQAIGTRKSMAGQLLAGRSQPSTRHAAGSDGSGSGRWPNSPVILRQNAPTLNLSTSDALADTRLAAQVFVKSHCRGQYTALKSNIPGSQSCLLPYDRLRYVH